MDEDNENKSLVVSAVSNKGATIKAKDLWDKIAICAQLISSTLLVVIGLMVTIEIDTGQRNAAKQIAQSQAISMKQIADEQIKSAADVETMQSNTSIAIAKAQARFQEIEKESSLDTANRQIASEYLGKFVASESPGDRAALLGALDVELEPRYSVPLALRFIRPVEIKAKICRASLRDEDSLRVQDALMRTTALALLQRLRVVGRAELEQTSRDGIQPDSGIASAVLGKKTGVSIRLTEIDDFADIYINDQFFRTYKYGDDSGWIDLTGKMMPNQDNSIYVRIRNSPYEGTKIRIEMRAGADQYDRSVYRDDWTGEGPAFGVGLALRYDPDGNPRLIGENIRVEGPAGSPHC